MLKRAFDFTASLLGLVILCPALILFMLLVWWQDRHSPFYIANRVGRGGESFRMVKLRSMIVGADRTGVDSTSADDRRITRVGTMVRRWKLDEVFQLVNVLKGEMSLVGPRPNVQADVDLYTEQEQGLLSVRPGITDLSSIVFSDEGEILAGSPDPDLEYNRIIRPWKSRLGLAYVEHRTFPVDIAIIFLTLVAIVRKKTALKGVLGILGRWGYTGRLLEVCSRREPLYPFPPPGLDSVVEKRPV